MSKKITLGLSVIFVACALLLLLVRVLPLADTSSNTTGYPNAIGIAELNSIDSFRESTSSEDSAVIAQEIAGRALSTPGLFSAKERASIQNEDQLRKLIEDRLRLMLNPKYEAFVAHIGDLLEQDGRAALQGTMFDNKVLWDTFADEYRYAGVSIDSVRATLDLSSVTVNEGLWGGASTTFNDPGVYNTEQLAENGAVIFSVSVPLMLPPDNTPNAKIIVVWGILSFVWNEPKGKWYPYRTSVYDPTGTLENVPPLWM